MNRKLFVNTCVFGVEKMPKIPSYIERFGERIGFEILSMFNDPDFEPMLQRLLPVYERCAVSFHGPVYCAEHSAAKGTAEYKETMRHVDLTYRYAAQLHASHFTMHLNNRPFEETEKDTMLQNAIRNYGELRDRFASIDCRIFVENTGTRSDGNMLLDQQEFTDVCRDQKWDVLIDLGHANANGWDIPSLITDLRDQIRAYHIHNNDGAHDLHARIRNGTMDTEKILSIAKTQTPDAEWILEYVTMELEGDPLTNDITQLIEWKEG